MMPEMPLPASSEGFADITIIPARTPKIELTLMDSILEVYKRLVDNFDTCRSKLVKFRHM